MLGGPIQHGFLLLELQNQTVHLGPSSVEDSLDPILEFVGSPDLQAKPDQFLTAPRPPLLKDYFDARLRSVLRVPRRSRQVKVTVVAEATDVPIG